jgi:hypothetical protein
MSLIGSIGTRLAWRYAAAVLKNRGWEIPDSVNDVLGALDKLRDLLGSDDAVIESLEQPKVCGVPDCVTLEARSPRWPANEITYGLAHPMPGMSQSAWEEAHRIAWGSFAKVCGLSITYNPNYRTANILVTVGRIDGVNGTLAWSELANGTMQQKTQKYDSGEDWGRVYLPTVINHEGGHAGGVPHLRQGALMQPTYDPRIKTFTQIDIDYLQNTLGYGPPKADPQEPLPPDPTDKELFVTMRADQRLIVTVKQ